MQKGKYSVIERERKFLLAEDLFDLENLPFKKITDNYLTGTMMRLRKTEDATEIIYKLTKKDHPNDKGEAAITTIYLDKDEYMEFKTLASIEVIKTRFFKSIEPYRMAIDRYTRNGEQLLIAEVEFPSLEEMTAFKTPVQFVREVTADHLFNGFTLAMRFQTQ